MPSIATIVLFTAVGQWNSWFDGIMFMNDPSLYPLQSYLYTMIVSSDPTKQSGFTLTPEQLEAAITPKTRALILCSPSNPTGSVYSKEELAGLARILAQHERVIVIADEIYEHINYIGKHESIAQFAEIKDRVVIVNGVSKAYAMTGWRIGFIAAPEWIVKGCNKTTRPIHQRPLLRFAKGRRSRLYGFTAMRRRHAPGF